MDILTRLEDFLDATPADRPELSREFTGPPPFEDRTIIERCQSSLWAFRDCDLSYPAQGREWSRWKCVHHEEAERRERWC